ncbi:MAG TPA: hypothetical protein VJ770_06470 [Stellaceae bacterium]|nr:hypothetical protein [Stellaceae bacterium]
MTDRFLWPELPDFLHEHQAWGSPGVEPPICEMLADPIVQAVMRRDGVSPAALRSVIIEARDRLRHRRPLARNPGQENLL